MREPVRARKLRNTGLPPIGEVPWGSHFCVFYQTKQDLLDILVSYFRAGLRQNEFCLWVVSSFELLTLKEARGALHRAFPNFDHLAKKGQIEIIGHNDWFLDNGAFHISKVVRRFQQKLDHVLQSGFAGLRVNGSSAWIQITRSEEQFRRFEEELDVRIANERIIVGCTFPLVVSGAEQILAAASTHHFTSTLRRGVWKRIQISSLNSAKGEERHLSDDIKPLTFRQRQILQLIAESRNTKEIADILEISIKTVEAHRVQLMRRLNIHNVAGLVRFAIRSGLVSAAA